MDGKRGWEVVWRGTSNWIRQVAETFREKIEGKAEERLITSARNDEGDGNADFKMFRFRRITYCERK